MRKEALMFCCSVIISTALFGILTTPALFIFGFIWLCAGDEVNLNHPDIEHYT